MTTKTETLLEALKTRLEAVPGAVVGRNSVLPERMTLTRTIRDSTQSAGVLGALTAAE